MEVKIERAWQGNLDEYRKVLDKFNATYKSENNESFALVEIKDLNQLFALSKEIGKELIISHHSEVKTIAIYDDYVE